MCRHKNVKQLKLKCEWHTIKKRNQDWTGKNHKISEEAVILWNWEFFLPEIYINETNRRFEEQKKNTPQNNPTSGFQYIHTLISTISMNSNLSNQIQVFKSNRIHKIRVHCMFCRFCLFSDTCECIPEIRVWIEFIQKSQLLFRPMDVDVHVRV